MRANKPEHVSAPLARVLVNLLRHATPEQRSVLLRKTESIKQAHRKGE